MAWWSHHSGFNSRMVVALTVLQCVVAFACFVLYDFASPRTTSALLLIVLLITVLCMLWTLIVDTMGRSSAHRQSVQQICLCYEQAQQNQRESCAGCTAEEGHAHDHHQSMHHAHDHNASLRASTRQSQKLLLSDAIRSLHDCEENAFVPHGRDGGYLLMCLLLMLGFPFVCYGALSLTECVLHSPSLSTRRGGDAAH